MSNSKVAVLVVEDDPIIMMGALELLIAAGFEALEARSADEAIQLLEARSDIHLVFTDIEMPGTMDGIKLCHYIRHRWPPVKLMVASGRTVLEGSHLPTGAMFFPKPYRDDAVVRAMRDMLS